MRDICAWVVFCRARPRQLPLQSVPSYRADEATTVSESQQSRREKRSDPAASNLHRISFFAARQSIEPVERNWRWSYGPAQLTVDRVAAVAALLGALELPFFKHTNQICGE